MAWKSSLCMALSAVLLIGCNAKPSPQNKRFLQVTMRKYAIEPPLIRAKKGETLILMVSTQDVQHGFQVEQLGINEPVQPGRRAEITVDTSQKGEFKVACSIICGPGHDGMQAKIIVE
ncbi:MAG TPA: cupredoxin domain-containing protein [Terriglobales bacterium]|nr:cupredoxin domain-containing protein [Terriglobales bacterium]